MQEIKYCNHCPTRANCIYFKKNSFCEKGQLLEEQIYGFDKTQQKLLFKLINIRNLDNNSDCDYYKKIRKEIKDIIEYFEELKQEEEESENARFQESESLAVE